MWLREFLKTDAKPSDIARCLSLCGPSIERVHGKGNTTVYDIEITGNRPDAMSVSGIARESVAILPRFGFKAQFINDPYILKPIFPNIPDTLPLFLKTDPTLNPRWTSVVFDGVKVGPSDKKIQKYLELSGLRTISNVVDITNYLMHAYGQPAHVFDYDKISGHTMTLRASKKGEILTTLDGKKHTLPGGDIVIEDKTGTLIDLCGIMGGENSSVTNNSKRVILFLQTYNPVSIRRTSMALAQRTEAATLFEKGLDTELVLPVFSIGMRMMGSAAGGRVAGPVTDIYPERKKTRTVVVSKNKILAYIGPIKDTDITTPLESLGFTVRMREERVEVRVPSWRDDVAIDVDIIEEIARIYGYHTIQSALPASAPPNTPIDPMLMWEENIKIRLRDWGYTELLTYSMIAQNEGSAYKILNPLSSDWVYMRTSLKQSVLPVVHENLKNTKDLKVFELSHVYVHKHNDLPKETLHLIVVWSGNRFLEAKGLAEALFDLFGIKYNLPDFGTLEVSSDITVLYLDFAKMVELAQPRKAYTPIPKYPPAIEDLSFEVTGDFRIGPLMDTVKTLHPLIYRVTFLDAYQNFRTIRIEYLDTTKNLSDDVIRKVRQKILDAVREKFSVTLKNV